MIASYRKLANSGKLCSSEVFASSRKHDSSGELYSSEGFASSTKLASSGELCSSEVFASSRKHDSSGGTVTIFAAFFGLVLPVNYLLLARDQLLFACL